ncbi:DUF2279 domain-containing protein [Lentimicrobium sp. L6]|uniref:DUF2279 domain-containing protein n=1 Tax=Lentimicrobium sp. L6 TaxID=2735916 RepID=UPI001551801A|nr:DUF2279 domain-containing protein [Lentimicrobium sp. L6]NPD84006.1 DUF2279 domain-containing protein [Lentimicrobium sp. L6]
MLKNLLILLFAFSILGVSFGQDQQDTTQIRKGRLIGVSALAGTAYIGGITGLYYLWYKDYDQSKFHLINDNKAWLQVDKVGHSFSAYQMGRVAFTGFRWAGLDEKKSVWIGGTYGFVFLTTVEVFDGLSTNWGFSWGDVIANAAGTGLFIGQQLGWKEQRIQVKFSYSPSKYAQYNPDLLGSKHTERFLKDYNAQTYWLSINPQSFSSSRKIFPKWLNFAVGYGAKGMTGTYYNPEEIDGETIPCFNRTRQFYLSLDLDLTKIKTRSEFLRLVLEVANMVKIPFPTLEYNSEDGVEFHAIYF